MSTVSQKLRIPRQICFDKKEILQYSAPYCEQSKIQHPINRVEETLKYTPASLVCLQSHLYS